MKYKPIFTIIICAYNAEKRIENAIESVVKQNFYNELVDNFFLVDNNSKDNTAQIMKAYEKKYNNVKYIFEEKQGLSYARLAGVNETNSEWIAFVDDDNILQLDWLKNAYKYINKEKNVGAFNGAVVPRINEILNEEQKIVLKTSYKGLACTHLDRKEIDYTQIEHPAKMPFGAGLVIKAQPLKCMAKDSWIEVTGRKGELLSSGEDTEMCLYVRKQGYEFGYNPYMLIEHIISQERLNKEYALRLWQGFAEYLFYKEKINRNAIYSASFRIKILIKYVRSKIFSKIFFSNEKKLNWLLRNQIDEKFFKEIIWKG